MTETVIGNYRILSELGQGACGRVYLAQHTVLEKRSVALKLMHNVPLHEHQEKNLFLQESHMLEVLHHPYILSIVDAGVHEGLPYIVTEYAPNGSLRQLLRQHESQPLSQDIALSILAQIGSALQYAHEQQVVHRDLKPENILFNAQGYALLADFGLAVTLSSMSMHITTGSGTPAYMAPEQLQGVASREGDQYALGCIAYELFTGQHLFNATTLASVMYHHLYTDPVPPSHYNPTMPPAIEDAILKALAKKRHDRHTDIAAFLSALFAPDLEEEIATYIIPIVTVDVHTKTFPQPSGVSSNVTTDMETGVLPPKADSSQQTEMPVDPGKSETLRVQPTRLFSERQVSKEASRAKRHKWFVVLSFLLVISVVVIPFVLQAQPSSTKNTFADGRSGASTAPSSQGTLQSTGTHSGTAATHVTPTASTQAGTKLNVATPTATAQPTNTPLPTPTNTPSPTPVPLNLTASPASYDASRDCTWASDELGGQRGGGTWSCSATLQSPVGAQKSLSWSASSSGSNKNTVSITFSPTSGSLASGQTATVNFSVTIYTGDSCTDDVQNTVITFTGPQNVVNSAWHCTEPTATVTPLNATTAKNCQLSAGQWQCTLTVAMSGVGEVRFSASSSNSNVTVSPYPTTALLSSPDNMSSQFYVSIPATACPGTFPMNYAGGSNGNVAGSVTC